MRSTVDTVRPDAENVAEAAAKVCAEQFASGRFGGAGRGCSVNLLPGEKIIPMIPSPAKGTALDSNPDVVDVQISCMLQLSPPGANPSESCGNGLASLRTPPARFVVVKGRGVADGTCRKSPNDCEEIYVPSAYSSTPDAVDLHLVKPVSGGPPGATVDVVVTLAKK